MDAVNPLICQQLLLILILIIYQIYIYDVIMILVEPLIRPINYDLIIFFSLIIDLILKNIDNNIKLMIKVLSR